MWNKKLVLSHWFHFSIYVASFYVNPIWAACIPRRDGTWAIGMIYGNTPFRLYTPSRATARTAPCTQNPILTCSDVTDVNASYVADPFLYFKSPDDPWYLFFEIMNFNADFGQIGLAISHDKGQRWKYHGVVLKEKWHLAYPLVFEHAGKMYIIPDTVGRSAYYEAEDFPFRWKQKVIMLPHRLVDASVLYYNDTWWMLGNYDDFNTFYLHLYYGTSPIGPWNSTPHNCFHPTDTCLPHKVGFHSSLIGIRNGGRPFVYKGSAYRVVQRTKFIYGDGLDVYRIKRLSKTDSYMEERVPEFRKSLRSHGNVEPWNSFRFHHLDLHRTQYKGRRLYVGVMDGDSTFDPRMKKTNASVVRNYC